MQLRGAIQDEPSTCTAVARTRSLAPAAPATARPASAVTRTRTTPSPTPAAAVAAAADGSDGSAKNSSLENEALEDALIGNDVLVEESRHHSKQLLALLQPVLGVDRCALASSLSHLVLVCLGTLHATPQQRVRISWELYGLLRIVVGL